MTLALLLFSGTAAGEDFTGRVVRIADGHTISVMRERREEKIRLQVVDPPEKRQPTVFCAGYSPDPVPGGSGADFLVRAYDARTGNPLWEDVANKDRDDFVQGIATSHYGAFVVGYGGTLGRNHSISLSRRMTR